MKHLLSTTFILLGFVAFSQQEVQFTQYMFNRMYYNPGVAGNGDNICVNGTHRSQWVGFDNAPLTQNINAHMPVKFLHGGVGINITQDVIGYFQDVSAGLIYAYQLPVANGKLGIGVRVDFLTKELRAGEWITPDNDPADPSLISFDASGFAIDPSFGVYYEERTWWAGASVSRLIESEFGLGALQGAVTRFRNARNLILMGGYNYFIPNSNIGIHPSAMIKRDVNGGPTQADINVLSSYNNQIWAGVGYRLQDAVNILIAYNIMPELRIAYSYDITTSTLSAGSSGSHEIFLSYCFKIELPQRQKGSYRNPIFL